VTSSQQTIHVVDDDTLTEDQQIAARESEILAVVQKKKGSKKSLWTFLHRKRIEKDDAAEGDMPVHVFDCRHPLCSGRPGAGRRVGGKNPKTDKLRMHWMKCHEAEATALECCHKDGNLKRFASLASRVLVLGNAACAQMPNRVPTSTPVVVGRGRPRQLSLAEAGERAIAAMDAAAAQQKREAHRKDLDQLAFLLASNLPFSVFEGPFAQNYAHGLGRAPVGRRALSTTMLTALHYAITTRIDKAIRSAKGVSVTVDGWQGPSKKRYLGVTVHFSVDFIKYDFNRLLLPVTGHETSAVIAEMVNKNLLDLFEDSVGLHAVVVDNCSTAINAAQLIVGVGESDDNDDDGIDKDEEDVSAVGCAAHKVQLVFVDLFGSRRNERGNLVKRRTGAKFAPSRARRDVKLVLDLVVYVRRSSILMDELRKRQRDDDDDTLELLRWAPTRWSYIVLTIERFLQLFPVLRAIAVDESVLFEDFQRRENRDEDEEIFPSRATIERLTVIVKILQPLVAFTRDVQGEYITMSSLPSRYRELEARLLALRAGTKRRYATLPLTSSAKVCEQYSPS